MKSAKTPFKCRYRRKAACSLPVLACVMLFGTVSAAVSAQRKTAVPTKSPDRPRYFIVNEDNDHYFTKNKDDAMNKASLEAYIDRIASGGKVTHFFMCPSGQRTSYDSKVWEPIWKCLEEPGGAGSTWGRRAKILADNGIDIYKVWIERCRRHGISPWLSPRMNDGHNMTKKWPLRNTTFWRTRTDLHCNTNRFGRGVFDFSHEEVRDYTFALVEELANRYDADGIELDFMRSWIFFPKGTGAANSHHLDSFVKRVRDCTEARSRARGRPLKLGVRVPTTPKAALAMGADVFKWVREGWVDVVCASDGWLTPDYNTPVDAWRKGFGAANGRVKLFVGCDHGVAPYRSIRTDMTPAFYAAFADVAWNSGADGVYLFNAIYLNDTFREVYTKGLMPGELNAYPRRRYPVTFRSHTYGAVPHGLQLPRVTDRKHSFNVRLGDNVTGNPSVLLGSRTSADLSPAVTLNGVAPLRSVPEAIPYPSFDDRKRNWVFNGRRYFFPPGTARPGPGNKVTTGVTETKQTIDWVEIDFDSPR